MTDTPQSEGGEQAPASPPRKGWFFVRCVLYGHLVAGLLTAAFSYVDSHGMWPPGRLAIILEAVAVCTICSIFVFPVLMIIALVRVDTLPETKLGIVLLEVAVIGVHFLAMVPAFQ